MTTKKTGLGRNLSALLSQSGLQTPLAEKAPQDPLKLAVNRLQPGKYQPRGEMDEEGLQELAASIKQQGVLQPLLIRPLDSERYEIIAGERRWRASQMAGLSEVPVVVKAVDDETAMAMALIENLQREDLNAMDQARAMYRLTTEFGLTHQQVAEVLAKSRTAVSNFLRLLTLSDPVKRLLEYGDLDMGHARALLILDEEQQFQAAQIVISKSLTVRETERLVARIKSGPSAEATAKAAGLEPEFHRLMDELSKHLNTKVQIKPKKAGQGTLVIHYRDQGQLERLLESLS